MEFRLLGPVEVLGHGRLIPLGGRKRRTLLATLLVEHGRVVSAAKLVDAVWGAAPPGTARGVLQTYVSALRRTLIGPDGAPAIVTQSSGYLLRVDPQTLDRDVFERQVELGRAALAHGRSGEGVRRLRAADDIWRGVALDDVDHHALSGEALRLEELRLTAVEERVATELALGHVEQACTELTSLVGSHPYRERLRGHLMTALAMMGRRSDALALYREARALLIGEMGIEPGPELRSVHELLLREDEASPPVPYPAPRQQIITTAATNHPTGARAAPIRPAQLPPQPVDFTGRRAVVESLVQTITAPAGRGTRPVEVIVGRGGVGKSALAVRVGHEVCDHYPDGQLYADLRGLSDTPLEPLDVLGGFLRALDVAAEAVPETLAERVQLYRTHTAGRRLLVLLDDAGGESQLRPLLPAAPGCAVLVTCRTALGGLDGIRLTELDVLETAEAAELLDRIVGSGRTRQEPAATRAIVEHCGGLPLAIRVAGARLVGRRNWPLEVLARRLADERRRLDELAAGDQEVRASFALSYQTLDPSAQAALRLLAVLGAPDFASWTVSAALSLSETAGEQLLDRLVDAWLVDVVPSESREQPRYRLHELVRLFARERAEIEDPDDLLRQGIGAIAVGGLHLIAAASHPAPSGEFLAWHPPADASPFDTAVQAALSHPALWLDRERATLDAVVTACAAYRLDDLACELAGALTGSTYPGPGGRHPSTHTGAARRPPSPSLGAVCAAEELQIRCTCRGAELQRS